MTARAKAQAPEYVRMELAAIEPAPYNPRTIGAEALQGLQSSIERFGLVQPLVWNKRTKTLVAGHQRLRALQLIGETAALVRVVNLSANEERALNVALNNPRIAGEFTGELRPLLEEIARSDADLYAALRLDSLQTLADKLQRSGFRTGEGALKDQITDWREAGDFFDVPADIAEALERTKAVVVEFSGGKDSSSVAVWAARAAPGKVLLTWVDPGVEFPGMSAHVAAVGRYLEAEVAIIKPTDDWWIHWEKAGEWPSALHRPCMHTFIHKPWARWVLANFAPEEVVVMTGSRAEEAVRGSKKTARSELASFGAKAPKVKHYAPCFNVKKPTLEAVLAEAKLPIWEGYSRGFVRTACWCCPFQCGLQALALSENYPGLAADIVRWEAKLGPVQPLAGPALSFNDLIERGKRVRQREARKARAPESAPHARRGKTGRRARTKASH